MEIFSGFIAYPAIPEQIGDTIEAAVSDKSLGLADFRTWKAMDIAGRFISDEIHDEIGAGDVFVADISVLNFNVTYEVGFAIGKRKRVILTKNSTVVSDGVTIQDVGIFDTLGYMSYATSTEFGSILSDIPKKKPMQPSSAIDRQTPAYLVLPKTKTDWTVRLLSRLKKARVFFRSFDPSEQSRLSAIDAIEQVSRSLGVLIPLEPSNAVGSKIHNLRAAFLAGLADGMGKVLFLLQQYGDPVPIDYRDLVRTCKHPAQIDEAVGNFASEVIERLQLPPSYEHKTPQKSLISRLDLGASTAENEIRNLAEYYLETDAYKRVLRGEVRLVVGRKGSGKTAVFYRVRDEILKDNQRVVLDLRPDGYQLVKFKEAILKLLEVGTLEHLITAFWEYLLLLEICNMLLRKDRIFHLRNHNLYQPYRELAEKYETDSYVAEGDFSERMATLLSTIAQNYQKQFEGRSTLSSPEITGLIYHHNVEQLRRLVEQYLKFKKNIWILFDNIDKGWPTHGLRGEDIIVIRTLVEASRKLEQSFQRRSIECHTVIFLRNDVFELLVDETPDRGKEARVMLDWVDKDALKELLRRRIVHGVHSANKSFDSIWHSICAPHVFHEDSATYLLERSLMRPRWVIDLVNHCRAFAVNVGHNRIQQEDVSKGLTAFSTDLVAEFGFELRDVFPAAADILYSFVGCTQVLSDSELRALLTKHGLLDKDLDRVTELLLWYGFLGLTNGDGEANFIFDVNYNMKLLQSLVHNNRSKLVYRINDAFCKGLQIK